MLGCLVASVSNCASRSSRGVIGGIRLTFEVSNRAQEAKGSASEGLDRDSELAWRLHRPG